MTPSHYELEVDVYDGPGMKWIVDTLADALEAAGYRENEYTVVVHGPPELRLGVVHR